MWPSAWRRPAVPSGKGPSAPTAAAAPAPPHPQRPPHLSVQAGRHCHDVPCLTVDGEHVLGGALRGLGHDPVAHHPIGRGAIVSVAGCDRHHVGAWNRDGSARGTHQPHPLRARARTPADISQDHVSLEAGRGVSPSPPTGWGPARPWEVSLTLPAPHTPAEPLAGFLPSSSLL